MPSATIASTPRSRKRSRSSGIITAMLSSLVARSAPVSVSPAAVTVSGTIPASVGLGALCPSCIDVSRGLYYGLGAHQFHTVPNRNRECGQCVHLRRVCEQADHAPAIVQHRTTAVAAISRVHGELVDVAERAHHGLGEPGLAANHASDVADAQ